MAEHQEDKDTCIQKPVVILAVDGSKQAEKAVTYYLSALHRPTNRIVVVHAVEMPYIPAPISAEGVGQILTERRALSEKVEKKYADLLKKNNIQGKIAVSDFNYGPGQFIIHKAKEEKATMIVMGTRGQGTLRRTIMGSVSDYVMHHAHCAVVICRE